MFVQRSEFNSGYRTALYIKKNLSLLLLLQLQNGSSEFAYVIGWLPTT